MADSEDAPAPMSKSRRLCLGAGIMLAALLATGAWVLRRGAAKADPEQIQRRVNALAQDLVRDHWISMRKAVEQLGTEEGARAFFADNPGLSPRIPSEAAFLEKVRSWRPLLRPLPEVLPGLETHDLSYLRKQNQTEMSYRLANGTCIFMKWSEGRLVEMRVY